MVDSVPDSKLSFSITTPCVDVKVGLIVTLTNMSRFTDGHCVRGTQGDLFHVDKPRNFSEVLHNAALPGFSKTEFASVEGAAHHQFVEVGYSS